MNYAVVDSGKVSNIIVADAEFAASIASQHEAVVDIASTRIMIGDSYAGGLFVSPLESAALQAGDNLHLSANAHSKLGAVTYQWKKDGTPIGGATSATYSISSVESGDAGSYTCDVTDGTNTLTSNAAAVAVS